MRTLCAYILAFSLSGCLHAPTLPKVVEVRYQTATGTRMSVICVHETRADTPPVTYECDTEPFLGPARRSVE